MRGDVSIKETCSCGGVIEISGYMPEVRAQIYTWRRLHKPHRRLPVRPEEKPSDTNQ